ncbi:MAG: hypothetical protein VX899_12825 [Myxococcota bacterium]|nr:hypothetical protein [Myxococcota bacterium]
MLLTALLSLTGCTLESQGAHLHIVGNSASSSEEEVAWLLELGEHLHTAIVDMHPADIQMDNEVRVELHGNYRQTSPYVDDDGTVHLWRFSEYEGGYRAMYAHELVHAVAYDSLVAPMLAETALLDPDPGGFYLEGWAEYVALQVDPEKTGFPLFGFDEDVVVGHWLQQDGPTLAQLRADHATLNMPCQGQAYILRASWFRYIDEAYGRELLMDLATGGEGLDDASVEALLGAPLTQIDADWAAWASARYEAHPDADAEAEAYLGHMGWYVPCEG